MKPPLRILSMSYNVLFVRRTQRMRGLWLAALLLLFVRASFGQSPAFDRASSLRHGVNLSGWFASSGDLTEQHFKTFTGAADLKLIHDMGFDSVRLGIDPSLIARHGSLTPANPQALAALDLAVDEIL